MMSSSSFFHRSATSMTRIKNDNKEHNSPQNIITQINIKDKSKETSNLQFPSLPCYTKLLLFLGLWSVISLFVGNRKNSFELYQRQLSYIEIQRVNTTSSHKTIPADDNNTDSVISAPQQKGSPPFPVPNENEKLQVIVWPNGEHISEAIHFFKDGIDQSIYLERSHNMYSFFLDNQNDTSSSFSSSSNTTFYHQTNMIWIGQAYAKYRNGNEWCHQFERVVKKVQKQRYFRGLPKCCWHIYIVDWTDGSNLLRCQGIEETMGPQYVHYSKRSIVSERSWNDTTQWINIGKRMENTTIVEPSEVDTISFTTDFNNQIDKNDTIIQYTHLNYPVRTDMVLKLQELLHGDYRHNDVNIPLKLSDPVETCCINRKWDVTHFWPLDKNYTRRYFRPDYPRFRWRISSILEELAEQQNYTAYINVAGSKDEKGRRSVSDEYIHTLLSSKIVVVTQRDQWEDHYRLMEAMISGAMIMTDRMLSLPEGYEDEKSIVEFSNFEELKEKIKYYMENPKERIAIAIEGRKLAMKQHRSWHVMEKLIFGRPVTQCDETIYPHCPFIANAAEALPQSIPHMHQ